MLSILLRFNSLIQLIKMKQKALRIKTKQLSLIINNNRQIKGLKKVNFEFQTVGQLFKGLILINRNQLITMLFLSLISLILRLFCANINNFIIEKLGEQKSTASLVYCILLLISYKIGKAFIDQWSSYLQMNYGFMGYSSLYYHFLKDKNQMTGEILNIVEDDMQKLINLPYSLINFPFLSVFIIVLTAMLAFTLNSNVILIVLISIVLYSVNCFVGIFIFSLNEKLMKQKDFRLSLNLSQNNNTQKIREARQKQVMMTRKFLMVKVIVKWLMEFAFVLIYGFVFLWNVESDQNDSQLYYRLMLLGMLKVSFNSLFMESYYIALVLNSLKRILLCQNREQMIKSTVGCYEDFLKKNAKKQSNILPQRQSVESSISDQSSLIVSLHSSSLRLTNEFSEAEISIQKTKTQEMTEKKVMKNKKKYFERGQIKIFQLTKYIKNNINFVMYISAITLGMITFYIKFENQRISSQIIHMKMNYFEYTIFLLPTVLYTFLYLSIILIFGQVSKNLFKNLNSQEIEGQDLNRISGDIQMVDKYVPPAFYEFLITIFGLLASLVLTISLIKDITLAILTAALIVGIIWLSIYFNRYFMKSRRQLKRVQCKNKSSILQKYAEHISERNEQQIPFSKVEKNWKKINLLKNMGIIIENSYIFLLNVFVLIIQVICFIICFAGNIELKTAKLILVFIFQLDLSLTGLLLNTINLQMGLVNFQRCLNFVKRKKSQKSEQNKTQSNQ